MEGLLGEIKKIIKDSKTKDGLIELDLSKLKFDQFTPEISALIEGEKSLEVLILSGVGLKTLAGFPKCKLQAIDLSDNKLGDNSQIEELAKQEDLTQVFLNNNNIKEMSTVLLLKDLKRLIEIDFSANPVAEKSNYPSQIFEKFAVIEFVDRKDKDGKEIEEEAAEGDFEDEEDDDDEDQYEQEDEDFSEDEDSYEEESEEKPKKGRKKK